MCFNTGRGEIEFKAPVEDVVRWGRALDDLLTGKFDLDLKSFREMRIKLRCVLKLQQSIEGKPDGQY